MNRLVREFPAFCVTGVVLTVWLIATTVLSLAPHALSPRGPVASAVQSAIVTIAPQRWEFFTASQQKPVITAYDATSLESLLLFPQTAPRNVFGLSRTQRAQGPELAILASEAKWRRCESRTDGAACLQTAQRTKPQAVSNEARSQTICGNVVIAQQKPTPFEFRRFGYGPASITRAAHLQVTCS